MKNINLILEKEVIDDGSVCVCHQCNIDEHSCPFKEEIYNDESLCSCCSYCSQQCFYDI